MAGKTGCGKPLYTANVSDSKSMGCEAYKRDNRILTGCRVFLGFPHPRKMDLVGQNSLCMRCLKPGHFARKCCSSQTCKKCGQAHHTLLHDEQKKEDQGQPRADSPSKNNEVVMHILCPGHKQEVLLMECQVLVIGPDGSTNEA